MKKPFSDNVIFIDTEFSSLNPYKGEILSIGLVKMNGNELYLELEYNGEIDEWPRENVLPTLTQPKISREEAVEKMKEFVGNEKPRLVAYINSFDMTYLYKLFGLKECNDVFHWIPIDFGSVLFAHGVDPKSLVDWKNSDFIKELGVDASKYNQHNALDDAKMMKEVYLKFFED
jgi:DNA polymerase-3 subunit epsilon